MKKFLLCGLLVMLSGCEPTVFGVPQSQWNTLTPGQKNQVIAGYNQRKLIDAQNAPIQNAIDTAGGLVAQGQDLSYQQNTNNNASFILPTPPAGFTPPPVPQQPKF